MDNKNKKEKANKSIAEIDYGEDVMPTSNKISLLKRFSRGLGYGSLFLASSLFFSVFTILRFLFTGIIGLLVIGLAIKLFLNGSIIIGLLVLFIGTPIALVLSYWLFIFWIILAILSGILWGVANLFGFHLSFSSAWDVIWLLIKVLILGAMAFLGIGGFVEAVKQKQIGVFIKEYWWGILLFLFFFWLFLLA